MSERAVWFYLTRVSPAVDIACRLVMIASVLHFAMSFLWWLP